MIDCLKLLSCHDRNAALSRYHFEKAKSIVANSAFAEITYSCEHYVNEVAKEERLGRHYGALVKLTDKAFILLTPADREVLKWRYILQRRAEDYVLRHDVSIRTYFRRLNAAQKAFVIAIEHIQKVHRITRSYRQTASASRGY